jgi:hypothetical protein
MKDLFIYIALFITVFSFVTKYLEWRRERARQGVQFLKMRVTGKWPRNGLATRIRL